MTDAVSDPPAAHGRAGRDLVSAIEHELRQRRFGSAVRLEVEDGMPDSVREFILGGIGLGPDDAYAVPGILDATCFWQLATLDRPELRDPPWTPVVPARLTPHDEGDAVDVFAAVRQGAATGATGTA